MALAHSMQAGSIRSNATLMTRARSTTQTINIKLQVPTDYLPLESRCIVNVPFHFTYAKVEPILDPYDLISQTYRGLSGRAHEAFAWFGLSSSLCSSWLCR